ncbi:hypothetical protein GJ496_005184 [Pomphorhynchus laevis]|nr:hypothetical protein GJ496_005184 [Pomphorhynchus laevis]
MIFLINLIVITFYSGINCIADFQSFWNKYVDIGYIDRCKLYESCSETCVNKDMQALHKSLTANLYGQPLALTSVYKTLSAHLLGDPERPLALSLHGPTGVGKNHIARLIVNSLYKLGYKSSFVHYFVASRDFPDYENKDQQQNYKRWLSKTIEQKAWKCPYSLFIFDEMDKMPINLIDVISSFLDFHSHEISSPSRSIIDFRKSIFIFLSNTGERLIVNHTLNAWKSNRNRDDLRLDEFEVMLTNSAFNENGGLWHTDLIKRHLISFFVPLLPLEGRHIRKCITRYLIKRNYTKLIDNSRFALDVMNELIFIPPGLEIFSSSGCKRIPEKVELVKLNYYEESQQYSFKEEQVHYEEL